MQRRWCEYHHPVYPKLEGVVINVEPQSILCTLTGHACLCESDWQHCTRREYALKYQAAHKPVPKQFEGVILTDGKGHVQDVL